MPPPRISQGPRSPLGLSIEIRLDDTDTSANLPAGFGVELNGLPFRTTAAVHLEPGVPSIVFVEPVPAVPAPTERGTGSKPRGGPQGGRSRWERIRQSEDPT